MRGGCGRALVEKFISSSEMSSICFNFQDLFLQSSVLIFSYFFQRVLFIIILAFSTEFCFYFREFCLFSSEFYLYFFWLFLQSSVSLSWAQSGYQSNRRRQLQRFGVDSFSAVTICQRRQTLIIDRVTIIHYHCLNIPYLLYPYFLLGYKLWRKQICQMSLSIFSNT